MGHEGMKASLVSREIIADSIEIMMIAHQYDAIIGIAGCDKSLPGTLMGMARVNMPAIFLYGGTILPGRWNNCDVTIQDVYEAVGAYEVVKPATTHRSRKCGVHPQGLAVNAYCQHDGFN